MYRGSWLVRNVVDAVAEDMIREGISIESDMPPDNIDRLMAYLDQLQVWQRLTDTIKWSRLYGGCLAVMMIDGQRPDRPLNMQSIGKDQFKGLVVLDRWMVWPHLEDTVTDPGPDWGQPRYYETVADAKSIPYMKIHHSRCLRFEGVSLPYFQRMAENNWGLSVIEPLYDRLLAFDSTTQGAAQLVYRAHLRTLKIEKLRELIAFGGEGYEAVKKQIQLIRLMQSNEGLTVLDSTDDFAVHSYAFGGLSDVLIQFAQQLAGAAQIPIVRLFGESPAGFSTGETDIRNYYDAINSQQEAKLRQPIAKLLRICHRSLYGEPLPDGFDFSFNPLWQLSDTEKAEVATNVVNAVTKAVEDQIITPVIALKELRQSSKITGIFSNITDEDLEEMENAPPPIVGEGDDPGEAPAIGAAPEGQQSGPGQPGQSAAPEHPPAAHAAPAASEGKVAEKQNDDDAEPDYSTMLPPYNRKHVAAMYRYMRDNLPDGMQAIIGPDQESEAVWIVQRNAPDGGAMDFQVMMGFADHDQAVSEFAKQFIGDTIGAVNRVSLTGLQTFIADAQPAYLNGGAKQ